MKPLDFTLTIYGNLLDALQQSGHQFQAFTPYLQDPKHKAILLRHDVDDRKLHSLAFAQLQHMRGIRGTYYFRMVPQSFDEAVVREIHDLGHEVGYHYEELDLCNGDVVKAYDLFRTNLDRLRAVVPVTSICMHGSPRSRFDNKDIWKRFSYRDLGIVGEPYLDCDFGRMAYFTDTGRCWDGGAFSVRDRVNRTPAKRFHHTLDMVNAINAGEFPAPAMLNFHPQRWTDSRPLWIRDRMVQYAKNYAKYGIIKWRALAQRPMS